MVAIESMPIGPFKIITPPHHENSSRVGPLKATQSMLRDHYEMRQESSTMFRRVPYHSVRPESLAAVAPEGWSSTIGYNDQWEETSHWPYE